MNVNVLHRELWQKKGAIFSIYFSTPTSWRQLYFKHSSYMSDMFMIMFFFRCQVWYLQSYHLWILIPCM
jgi:hypothetical protein